MLLGTKSRKTLLLRHILVGSTATALAYGIFLSRDEFPFDVSIWRALGDTAFIFLFFTLAVGPLAKLWKPALRFVSWRRETGIWFALLALAHFIRVIDYALLEPGIELARLLGFVALFWALVLAATSSDRAVNFLGPSAWKWLHGMAYVIFYLVAAHAMYFLFWHYPETNWFQYAYVGMVFAVPLLQIAAFVKEVVRQRAGKVILETKKLQLPILEQRIIAEKTCEISFDLSGKEFEFLAGQYIRVGVPTLLHPDPRGSSRLFSLTSSPTDVKRITVAFRNSGSGFKKTLMELLPGSPVSIEGPFGYLTLPKDDTRPLVFIAGGIGITPFMSMIRFVTKQKTPHKITLLYANRTVENAAYIEELTTIAKQNPLFSLQNRFGRIDAEFIQKTVQDLDSAAWYIVGLPVMVADMHSLLLQLGVKEDAIYFEDFTGY